MRGLRTLLRLGSGVRCYPQYQHVGVGARSGPRVAVYVETMRSNIPFCRWIFMRSFYRRSYSSQSKDREVSEQEQEQKPDSSPFSQLCPSCLTVPIPPPTPDENHSTQHWTTTRIHSTKGLEDTIHSRQGSYRISSTRSKEEHYASANEGCLLCQLLYFANEKLGGQFEFNIDGARWHREKGKWEDRPWYDVVNARFAVGWPSMRELPGDGRVYWNLRYNGFTDADDPAGKYISGGGIDQDVGSERSFERASTWIQECLGNHGDHAGCPKYITPTLPTRVIDVSHKDPDRLKLLESHGRKGDYVALSYVWGGPQDQSTTISNSKARAKGFKLSSLPRTLRDAVIATRKLGLNYLWVDSMCILQDNADLKQAEMGTMAKTYKNAYVTIIASSGNSCHEGFLEDRSSKHRKLVSDSDAHARPMKPTKYLSDGTIEGWNERPEWDIERSERAKIEKPEFHKDNTQTDIYDATLLKLPYRCPDGNLGTLHLSQIETLWIRSDQPIYKRAWAIQERFLSPRVLSYCTDRLIFRCQNTCVENGMRENRNDNKPSILEPAFFAPEPEHKTLIKDSEDLSVGWKGVVYALSTSNMSLSSDALPAISGLAEEYARLSGDEYLAGIWKSTLPGALMWEILTRVSAGVTGFFLTRVKPYRAPSWSWASMEGGLLPGIDRQASDLEFVDCKIKLRNAEAPFGEVTEGILTLKGKLMRGWVAGRENPRVNYERRCAIDFSHHLRPEDEGTGRDVVVGTYFTDVDEEPPEDLYFLKVCNEDRDRVAGLVLTTVDETWFEDNGGVGAFFRTCGTHTMFRRVGIFRLDYNQEDRFKVERFRTIRMV